MPLWRKGNRQAQSPGLLRWCGGRSAYFGERTFWSLFLVTMIATSDTVAHPFRGQALQKPTPKTTAAKKANELTLAGLRPGKDTTARLFRLYPNFKSSATAQDGQLSWEDPCLQERLTVDVDNTKNVQVIRVGHLEVSKAAAHCEAAPVPSRWRTGLGLRILDQSQSVIQLYGEPDSRSPSTKDGQPLELWYYAFDWAGPDVPQVMEVVCTREKDGQAGRVVEITLAAPSL
ncbi:MAG TPA: hypothetical protein VGF61_16690 [Candidatus Acidoferrum sp.]|jgi:hypothetical protein